MILIKVVKKMLRKMKGSLNLVYNKLVFILKRIEYNDFPLINGRMFITNNGKIKIGSRVKINSSLSSNPIGGDTKTVLFADKGAKIEIGDFTGMSNCAIVSKVSVTIGSNVRIGGSTKIYDTDFHSLNLELRISKFDNDINSKPIIIEDGVFIGGHSIILKGVTIGERSVIGAGSVVTKNVPSNEIWAGNPAKFIKKL